MVFVESQAFTHRLAQLAGASADDVLRQIQDELMENPERGNTVKGTGGVRKARAANPARGKGKRGGFRYLFIYLKHRQHIHLLYLLDKDEQDDLDNDQRKALRKMTADLKRL